MFGTLNSQHGSATIMRRLVIEISKQELERLGLRSEQTLERFESVDVIHYLTNDDGTSAVICKVVPKDRLINENQLIEGFNKFEVLSRSKDGLIIYAELPSHSQLLGLSDLPRVYFFPIKLVEGTIRINVLGDEVEMRKLLKIAENVGVKYKILSSTDANFVPSSILSHLTIQQNEFLSVAYRLGYFEVPRKITTAQLAQKLGIAKSTLSEHLRRAQLQVLTEIMRES